MSCPIAVDKDDPHHWLHVEDEHLTKQQQWQEQGAAMTMMDCDAGSLEHRWILIVVHVTQLLTAITKIAEMAEIADIAAMSQRSQR